MQDSVFPLQQGQLDWMCSIYAAINLMHVHGMIKTFDDAVVPFRRAIDFMQSESQWNLAKAITEGIDEEDCGELFKNLSGRNWDVFPNGDCPDRFLKIKQLLDDGAKGVIVSLVLNKKGARDVLHYTVVTGASPKRLTIYDSQGKTIEKIDEGLWYDGCSVRLGFFFVMKAK